MHTYNIAYHKLRAFVLSQGSKITLSSNSPWTMDHLKLIKSKGMDWKHLAYAQIFIHTVLGFVMVTTVAYAIPEVIHSPTRLTTFWMYIFTYLFLGLLSFLGLYQKSCSTVKVAITMFIFLQLTVLLIAIRLLSQCDSPPATDAIKVERLRGIAAITEIDCKYSSFIFKFILIPLFIHTLIFCTVFITYIFKFDDSSEDDLFINSSKKCHQFANIKIIIEEVP